jgi:hypothetical protein
MEVTKATNDDNTSVRARVEYTRWIKPVKEES